jgi:hypothetical protein
MAGSAKDDVSTPSGDSPMLARLTDGRNIAIFNGPKGRLPDAEWFEVSCADEGHIALTPVQSAPDEALAWAQEKDVIAAAQQQRPYQHLTVDELREVEELTIEERLDELRARGILQPAWDGPPPAEPFKPVSPPVPPGALERFLKERG